jgi:hypothetical protein
MKKTLFLVFGVLVFSVLLIENVFAADAVVFDSTDNYLGGCKLTDKSAWELKQDLYVSNFQIWYNWNEGETTLPVTVYKDGKEFAKFDAKRGDCDAYQKKWCNADYALNQVMPKGNYTTQIPDSRQCLKPGSTGTVRLYGSTDTTQVTASTNTASENTQCEKTKCTNSIIIYSVISFVAGSLIFYFIGKKSK